MKPLPQKNMTLAELDAYLAERKALKAAQEAPPAANPALPAKEMIWFRDPPLIEQRRYYRWKYVRDRRAGRRALRWGSLLLLTLTMLYAVAPRIPQTLTGLVGLFMGGAVIFGGFVIVFEAIRLK